MVITKRMFYPRETTILLLLASVCLGDIYTSVERLQDVALRERQLAQHLRTLKSSLLGLQHSIDRYLDEFDVASSRLPFDNIAYTQTVAGNPLHAFQMIRRIVLRVEEIKRRLLQTETETLEDQLMGVWPNQNDDLHGAVSGLLLLQDIYQLDANQLARGMIYSYPTTAKLSATESMLIAQVAQEKKVLDRSIEWYEVAVRQTKTNQTSMPVDIELLLQAAINKHDELHSQGESASRDYRLFHQPVRLKAPKDQRDEINSYAVDYQLYDEYYDAINYPALCKGYTLLPVEEESKLTCYLLTRDNPFLLLQPVKVEQNSLKPNIVTFHDIISDSEIEQIQKTAKPMLDRSTVKAVDSSAKSDDRTSQTAWITDENELVLRLSKRVADITGLDTNSTVRYSAEQLQVLNYGIGGQYRYHHDYMVLGDKTQEMADTNHAGDRIATFMFYLSDVEMGGWTAFPRAGISISPSKGSAAFWYNLKDDGSRDPLTLHAGCPVILGSKWVANKWILEKGQMFRQPCLPGLVEAVDEIFSEEVYIK